MAAATSITVDETPLVVQTGSFTLDPANVSTGNLEESTVAVPGTKLGDFVMCQPRAVAGVDLVIQQAYVSADGTITFQLYNISGGDLNMAAATWDYVVIRGRNTNIAAG